MQLKYGIQWFSNMPSTNMGSKWRPELFWPKTYVFWGGAPKSDRKLKLSDFDEIWFPRLFDGTDFKNGINFVVTSLLGAL